MIQKIKDNWKEYAICIVIGAVAVYLWKNQTKSK